MATEHEHVYVLKAEFDQLQASLKKLEANFKTVEKAAAKASTEADRAFDQVAKESAKAFEAELTGASKEVEKASKEAVEGVALIFKAFEGQIGGATSVVEDFTDGLMKMSARLGPTGTMVAGVGLAAAAAAFLVVGLGSAMIGLADGAEAAQKRLKESRDYYELDPEASRSVDRYTTAKGHLQKQVDELTVKLAGPFADALSNAAVLVSNLTDFTSTAIDKSEDFYAATEGLRAVVSLGIVPALQSWYEELNKVNDAQLDAIEAWERSQKQGQGFLELLGKMAEYNTDWGEGTQNQKDQEQKRTEALRESEKAMREYQAAVRETAAEINDFYRTQEGMAKKAADSNKALAAIVQQSAQATMTAEQRINAVYDAKIEQIREYAKTASDTEAVVDALASVEKARAAELAKSQKAEAEGLQKARGEWDKYWAGIVEGATSAAQMADEASARIEEETRARQEEGLAMLRDGLIESAAYISETITTFIVSATEGLVELRDRYDERIKQQKDGIAELKKQERQLRKEGKTAHADQLAEIIAEREEKLENTKQDREGVREVLAERQKALVKAHRLGQAAALADVAVNAAVASTALLASMAFLGPGAPLAVAAIVGPMVAASVAKITAQKPPKLHDGGMGPDEYSFAGSTVRSGESYAVFNQRATETGAAAVAAANMGLGDSDRPIVLQLLDAGEVIGEAWLRAVEGTGQTARGMRAALTSARR